MDSLKNSRFLRALRNEPCDATPIWLMRQAGRYMKCYRELRARHDLLTLVKTPALAAEVTLQPINSFELDAAIIFSDILPLLEGMGFKLKFLQGEGPHIENPITVPSDIDRLRVSAPEECMDFTLQAIKLVVADLEFRNIPLIGFSGAPFTLASYAIEGGSNRELIKTKKLMYEHPDAFNMLMSKLSHMIGEYLLAQAKAGAQVLQMFDSWVGVLSKQSYLQYVFPHVKQIVKIAKSSGVPIIYFSTGTAGCTDVIKGLEADAISIDWRSDILDVSSIVGDRIPIQGNLDPALLQSSFNAIEPEAKYILEKGRKLRANGTGYIFNLGHGVLQHTPEDNVKRLVDLVHEYQ